MHNKMPLKQIYGEKQAAEILGITIPQLHEILDRHVFNDGAPRPENVEFTSSDLLMMGYWAEKLPGRNVVAMPSRN